jgi:hypothetical protein
LVGKTELIHRFIIAITETDKVPELNSLDVALDLFSGVCCSMDVWGIGPNMVDYMAVVLGLWWWFWRLHWRARMAGSKHSLVLLLMTMGMVPGWVIVLLA